MKCQICHKNEATKEIYETPRQILRVCEDLQCNHTDVCVRCGIEKVTNIHGTYEHGDEFVCWICE